MAWNRRKERGEGSPACGQDFNQGSSQRTEEKRALSNFPLGRGPREKGALNVPSVSKGPLHSYCELSPAARRSGHPRGGPEAHYVSGKRSRALWGEAGGAGPASQFPGTQAQSPPLSLLSPCSTHPFILGVDQWHPALVENDPSPVTHRDPSTASSSWNNSTSCERHVVAGRWRQSARTPLCVFLGQMSFWIGGVKVLSESTELQVS